MKKALCGLLAVIFLAIGSAGCAPLFLMAVGGVGVYAVSRDTIRGESDTPYESLWDAAVRVARIRGAVIKEDFNQGLIEVDAKPNKIWINFTRLTTATTRMRVSARKYKLPNIDLAQDIFIKIIEESRLATSSGTWKTCFLTKLC